MSRELPDPATILFGEMMYSADQMREYAALCQELAQRSDWEKTAYGYKARMEAAQAALASRQEQPVSEDKPVAWMHNTALGEPYFRKKPQDRVFNPRPVYLHPAPADQVRDAALEEAALECEREIWYEGGKEPSAANSNVWDAAKSIRALKGEKK